MFPRYPEAQRLPSYQGVPLSTTRALFLPLQHREWLPVSKLDNRPGVRLEPNITG